MRPHSQSPELTFTRFYRHTGVRLCEKPEQRTRRYRFILFFFSIIIACGTHAQTPRIDSLKTIEKDEDDLSYINLWRRPLWDVVIQNKDGTTRALTTKRPDTMTLKKVSQVQLSTTLNFSRSLINETHAFVYGVTGSLSISVNGEGILNTGLFNKDKHDALSAGEISGYADVNFRDTLEKINIRYIPDPRMDILNVKLSLCSLAVAEKGKEERLLENNDYFSEGYYFLAFGIVFLLFFFFLREKTENLYFALFCLCASMYCLCETSQLYLNRIFGLFFLVYSFEFLSFFFAKVLRNKNKSRISLVVRLIITAICFHPAILYSYTLFGKPMQGNVNVGYRTNAVAPLLLLLIFAILFCISSISWVYNLVRGFKQKRWEAKTIVYVSLLAIAVKFALPIIVSLLIPSADPGFSDKLSDMSIYLYPLSAAIVLSRTNGLNQKKLIKQLFSIEKLSAENIAKEKETKQILENQNIELEKKVMERTKEVSRQKEIIEIKNRAITDNLTYAQRIQSAILPDIKLIYKALEQSFILYLPKDIVSGDFYAFSERNGRVLIIAADCTGHGVSGAFMSMIGGSLLNQIINERGIEQPAEILNQLNSSVIASLKQSENESNDGMDVSICSFDLNTNELQYAGANRPLWLIRNNEITIVKPDKFPIGGLQSAIDRNFTNHKLQLQKNDSIYIFTDGYADQFGGENNKKMMTSKFKKMLLSIQEMDMRQQETYLNDYFENWRGGNEQLDDVLVIGVRV